MPPEVDPVSPLFRSYVAMGMRGKGQTGFGATCMVGGTETNAFMGTGNTVMEVDTVMEQTHA
jgi:hypothetical protein